MPTKSGRRASPTWEARVEIGIVEVLLAKIQPGSAHPVERAVDLGLDRLVLEHRLGDEVAVGEIGERGRRADPAERRLLVLGLEEAALDAAVERRRKAVLGRRELFVGAVREHDIVAGEREHERDLRPHQPGADNADFF